MLLKSYKYYDNEDRKKFRNFLIYPCGDFTNIDDKLRNIIIDIYNKSK